MQYMALLQSGHPQRPGQQTGNNSRLEDSVETIEQYSRKLQEPNPVLDGGTGSGGAQNLQLQTRLLLNEQQALYEKMGYPPAAAVHSNAASDQSNSVINFGNVQKSNAGGGS